MKTSSYYNEIIWVEQKKTIILELSFYKNVGLFSSSFFKNERKLHTVYERGNVQNRNIISCMMTAAENAFLAS